jgi:hypothetical protein
MDLLASFFVAKPFNILAVALLFMALYGFLRFTAFGDGKITAPILVAGVAWALYAAWEWLVQVKTPEADIRVDLMLIWPVAALISIWAAYKFFR